MSNKGKKRFDAGALAFGDTDFNTRTPQGRPLQIAAANEWQRQSIRLSQIRKPSRIQGRRTFDPSDPADAALIESVRAHGSLEDVGLRFAGAEGNTKLYDIVFGHRRVEAARLAGLTVISAKIAPEDISESELDTLTLIENVQRRDLSPGEMAEALRLFFENNPGVPQKELAREMAISETTISKTLKLYESAPVGVIRAFEDGLISLNGAYDLRSISVEEGEAVFTRLMQGEFITDLKDEAQRGKIEQAASGSSARPKGDPRNQKSVKDGASSISASSAATIIERQMPPGLADDVLAGAMFNARLKPDQPQERLFLLLAHSGGAHSIQKTAERLGGLKKSTRTQVYRASKALLGLEEALNTVSAAEKKLIVGGLTRLLKSLGEN